MGNDHHVKSQIKEINRSRPVSKEAAASARKINVSFGKLDVTDEIGVEFCEIKAGSEGATWFGIWMRSAIGV